MEENRKVSTCRRWKLGRHYTCLWAASRGYSSINTCSIKCIWLSVPWDIWQMTNMRQSLMKAARYTSHTCVSHETIIRDTTRSTRCSSFIISFLIFMCAYDGFVCVCVCECITYVPKQLFCVEVRGQPWVSVLAFHSVWAWCWVQQACRTLISASHLTTWALGFMQLYVNVGWVIYLWVFFTAQYIWVLIKPVLI